MGGSQVRVALLILTLARPLVDGAVPRPNGIHHLMRRIARAEGWHVAGTIVRTHNNPGALVYRHQRGAVAGARGHLRGLRFARFGSERDGWAALERDIRAKQRRGVPLRVGWRYL